MVGSYTFINNQWIDSERLKETKEEEGEKRRPLKESFLGLNFSNFFISRSFSERGKDVNVKAHHPHIFPCGNF